VLAHAALAHQLPVGAAAVEGQGAADGGLEGLGGEASEDEAGGVVVQGFEPCVGHRVGQPADPAHQRQRAVGEAVQLGEPAGFVVGRHHYHVAGGDQPVGEGLVVADAHRHRRGVGLGGGAEGGLQGRVAAAQQRKLGALLDEPGQGRGRGAGPSAR
jgi:hypothetical protein